MAASGEKLVATATARARNDAAGSTSNTSYTGSLTSAGSCGVPFVAPPSGAVTVYFGTTGFSSAAAAIEQKTAVRVGEGATVGAGTEVHAANDNDMILFQSQAGEAYGLTGFADVDGLTPGDTYNAQMQHKVNSGTGNWQQRRVKVIPDA